MYYPFIPARVGGGVLGTMLALGIVLLVTYPLRAILKKRSNKLAAQEKEAFRARTGAGPRTVYVVTQIEPMLDGERFYLTYGSGKRRILDPASLRDRFPTMSTEKLRSAKVVGGNIVLPLTNTVLTAEYLYQHSEPASPSQAKE